MRRILRYGMVGGGQGAFIGEAHRRAINLDSEACLVAGCFSRSYANTMETGQSLGLDPSRCYESYEKMAAAEAEREDGIDFVSITSTNISHYEICRAFLLRDIHVACEKPLTVEVWQAEELKKLAEERNLLFLVTYVYSGHVTARHAREIIRNGEIGEIRTIMAEYPQGYLAPEGNPAGKQSEWRCDPKQAGKTNALGDIGTHIENTVSAMTGLKIKRLLAKMDIVVPGRVLDDNDFVMVEYEGGATGMYWSSQVAIGHDNGLRVRIYGSKGSIRWFQENPEVITVYGEDGIGREIHRGYPQIAPNASKYSRLPSGHTEGYFEAMGNLYRSFFQCIHAAEDGALTPELIAYPTIDDGIDGVRFIEACLRSNAQGNIWVEM